jgi:hypothetical protein
MSQLSKTSKALPVCLELVTQFSGTWTGNLICQNDIWHDLVAKRVG